ncbi:MAG TPA: hypothetical protein VJW55_05145, partial [Candidatus Angelobacter sp.]|nr:hypothetical protein [Candidatus Angelobacter sp.]
RTSRKPFWVFPKDKSAVVQQQQCSWSPAMFGKNSAAGLPLISKHKSTIKISNKLQRLHTTRR